MRKIFFLILLSAGLWTAAQSSSDKNFQQKILQIEQAKNGEALAQVVPFFENPANDTSLWQPGYYAVYAALKQAELYHRSGNEQAAKMSIEKAERSYQKILHLAEGNSEIRVLYAYLNILKIRTNMTADLKQTVREAKKYLYLNQYLDAANPRIDLMRAHLNFALKYHQMGKDLTPQFQAAATALRAFKPASSTDPNWGASDAAYYLSLLPKKTSK